MVFRPGRSALMASVSLLALLPAAYAQEARTPSAQDEITISAERTPSTVYNSPGTVTVINRDDLERQQVQNARDAVRYEPGIASGNIPTRAGGGGYTIRGIGDNRVRMEIDGVRVPDYPSSSSRGYNRDIIDYESLKRVEIIRGPASALYGSDAIGGVVSFVTKDPSDYLREVGRDWYAGLRTSFNSVDRSFGQTITGATRRGPFEFLIEYTRRDGSELEINSATRRANPQYYQSNNLLAKLIYETPDSGRWRLTGEAFVRRQSTEMLSSLTSTINRDWAYDSNQRFRVSLDWTQQLGWAIADEVKAMIYTTQFNRRELEVQIRSNSTLERDIYQGYRQQIIGADLQFSARRQFLGLDHHLVYGFNADATWTTRPYNTTQEVIATGLTTTLAGYPSKYFPDTRTITGAFYIQDTIQYGALRVIPAVRFDVYNMVPFPDQVYWNNGTAVPVSTQTAFAVSPKLGVTYDLNENLRVFAQFARGFRAPPYDSSNFAFVNTAQFYQILPNPNLRPETSTGFEGGLRGRFADGSSFQVSAFYNTYTDFIDSVTVAPQGGLLTFQYQNLPSVRIWGFEGRGEWRITPEWSLTGAIAYANGTDTITGKPIDSVDPLTGTAGVRYSSANGWSLETRLRAAASKTRVSDDTYLKPGGWATVDMLGRYEISRNLTVTAQVLNILNARYFNSRDVVGLAANSSILELYRAPGRSVSVTVSAKF